MEIKEYKKEVRKMFIEDYKSFSPTDNFKDILDLSCSLSETKGIKPYKITYKINICDGDIKNIYKLLYKTTY